MQINTNTTASSEAEKWKKAKKRVAFKYHFLMYVLINIFLWVIWYINTGGANTDRSPFPWPLWLTFIWGIGIIYNCIATYGYKISLLKRNIES